ncbi:MAG: beta-ketoacyl-[acyl-carrier-protein] synthase family protein [Lentisphaeria bacterium]|nr:beta-ketoacyl-[acyl-carrier-protein] synthase family protein [Lentisphaeria bacterium]
MEKRRAAVTGIGVVSPLGNSASALFEALKAGRSGIRAMTEWHDYFGRNIAGSPVTVDPVEAKKISRKIRRTMGNAALFAGLAAQEAVTQSGLDPAIFTSGRVGCVIGSTVGSASSMTEACVAEYEGRRNDLSACHFFRLMSHSSSFNVADLFGINGPQLSTNSACASGLQALGTALELIQLGKADVVLAGGSDESTPLVASSFQLLYALAEEESSEPEKLSRPFDAARTGLVCSEGAGILVVEEYEHAKRRGADILFEIAGYATNCSGWHVSHSDELQIANCMKTALADAGIGPEAVDYVSAHATGTKVGDHAEAAAIRSLLGDRVPVSSLKGHLGHTLGASGALELAAVHGMMRENLVLPTRNLETVDDCAGIRLPRTTEEHPVRVCLKNSIAFGGVNASLVCRKIS